MSVVGSGKEWGRNLSLALSDPVQGGEVISVGLSDERSEDWTGVGGVAD